MLELQADCLSGVWAYIVLWHESMPAMIYFVDTSKVARDNENPMKISEEVSTSGRKSNDVGWIEISRHIPYTYNVPR